MKNTNEIAKIALLNALVAFDGKTPLLAAGPLVKQPHTKPYRIVLVDRGDRFSVHTEYLNDANADLSQPITCGSSFEGGDYYWPDQLTAAYTRFGQRIAKTAEYVESIYRLVDAA
jgi:hypothetical protein